MAAAGAAAGGAPQPATDARVCILQKLVHASERQWARLVIPGAQVGHFTAMQAELKAQGKDVNIYVRDPAPSTRTWRWLCRMTVQRPMILDCGAFYAHHGVNAGDIVSIFRGVNTNVLSVELTRGSAPSAGHTGGVGAAATTSAAALAAAEAAAMGPQPQPQEQVPQFAPGQLPGQAWDFGPRGGKRSGGGAAAATVAGHVRVRSPGEEVEEEEEYCCGGGYEDDDYDYSPTHASRGHAKRSAGHGPGHGPLAVRRVLHKLQPQGGSADGSDQESTQTQYTASQTRLFEALVDVALGMSQ